MSSFKKPTNNEGRQRKRGNFDSVPADDGFRNYMSRKIELQRKQFGLVVPPPPSPSPPSPPIEQPKNYTPPKILKKSKLANKNSNSKHGSDTDNITSTTPPEKKSVRFHQNLHVAGGGEGVSRVLNNLKQRHTIGKKRGSRSSSSSSSSSLASHKRRHRRRRKSHIGLDANQDSILNNTTSNDKAHNTDSQSSIVGNKEENVTNSNCTSILGVLDNLQKRHGTSTKRKNRSSSSSYSASSSSSSNNNSSTKKLRQRRVSNQHRRVGFQRHQLQPPSFLESLDSVAEDSIASCATTNNTPPLKRRRESPRRCKDRSILEGLEEEPITHNGRKHGIRKNDCPTMVRHHHHHHNSPIVLKQPGITTNQHHHHHEEQITQQYSSKSALSLESYDLFNSPIPPTRDSQGAHNGHHEHDGSAPPSPQNLEQLHGLKSPLGLEPTTESHTGAITPPFASIPTRINPTTTTPPPPPPPSSSPVADYTSTTPPPSSSARTKSHHRRTDLFLTGIVILVNGHTTPDATTLMRLLHKHGGDLEKYETSRVTHIIAEQLSVAKANIYKRQKKPTPVCRPEWILDCVEKGKLVPFGEYLLEDVREDGGRTTSVQSYFNKKSDQSCLVVKTNRDHNVIERKDIGHEEMKNGSCCSPKKKKSSSSSHHHRWQDTHPSKANYNHHHHLGEQIRTVGNDPNFLDSYFSNSRLSYIGSFKQRVKPTKNKPKNKNSNTVSSSSSRFQTGGRKFVLLVDMDCFFASVALRKYPQYRNKPVAVGHAHSAKSNASEKEISTKTYSKNSSSELSTCNYVAREHGIKKGMFLGDAIRLCPDLVVLPYDFQGFEEVSGIVADALHGYAEEFNGCVEQVSCDESYVEINIIPEDDCPGNDVHDFVNSLAQRIRGDIVKKTECTASIGIGPNKLLAKLAADKVKPNACCVVKDWRGFLDDLNLRDIPGIGRKFQKKLQPHGLCKVNDIWDLEGDAENVLGGIIGAGTAHKIVQYCHGKDDRVVTPAIRKSIGAECNYGVRFDGPYGVDYMIQGLAKEVQKRMTGAGVRGAKLVFKVMKSKDPSKVPGKFLGHGSCDSISRSVDISLTRDKDFISSAAMKLYNRLAIDKKLVRGMGIVIGSLKSDDEVDSLNSSPSKLSVWLKKDSATPTNSESLQAFEESQTPNQVTFSIDNDGGAFKETMLNNSDLGGSTMPTFSQLDQDILQNLPADILSEVKSMYGKNSIQQTQNTSHLSLKSPIRRHAGKVNKSDKPIPIAGQTSVRRMLKLACVKSGEDQLDENVVSLSQLDNLPLEVQLQIANGDDIEIAKRQKQKTKCMNNSQPLTYNQEDLMDVEVLSFQSSHIEAQEEESQNDVSPNFYHENIAPLRDYISSHPNPDSDMVEAVKKFLSLCINEKRISDAVILLRTIKNMHDGWDNKVYSQLRESALYKIYSTTGSQLDMRWLGL